MPGFFNVDVSSNKNFVIHESQSLNFRPEFYNLANVSMFGSLARGVDSPFTFGVISSRAKQSSQHSIGLELRF